MSSSSQRKKDKKARESEKFDANLDMDLIPVTGNTSSSASGSGENNSPTKKAQQPGSSKEPAKQTGHEDLSSFCDILKKGFESVSNKLSEKLDNVGKKVSKSVEDANKSLREQMMEMSKSHEESRQYDNDEAMGYGFDADTDSESERDSMSTADSNNNDSFFKQLNKPPPAERVGDKINEDLAEATDRFFRKPMSVDEFKEMKVKYVRPENVQWLRAPDIPQNVYKRLPSEFKNTDKILFYIQEQLSPVACALTYAVDKIGEGDVTGGLGVLSDTLGMFGHVFRTNITDKRRNLLKNKLPEDFKILTTDKCDPTPTSLLGDMGENSKKISETEKLTAQMDRATNAKNANAKKSFNRNSPYYKGDSSFKKGGSYGKKYDNQKKNYDRKDDRGYKGNSKQSFHRGGQNRK